MCKSAVPYHKIGKWQTASLHIYIYIYIERERERELVQATNCITKEELATPLQNNDLHNGNISHSNMERKMNFLDATQNESLMKTTMCKNKM
jgi:hypothetical protein